MSFRDAGKIIAKNFGRKLGEAYALLPDMTWEALAVQADVDAGTLKKLAAGNHLPQLETAIAIVKALSLHSPQLAATLLEGVTDIRRTVSRNELDVNRDGRVDMNDAALLTIHMGKTLSELQRIVVCAAAEAKINDEIYGQMAVALGDLTHQGESLTETAKYSLKKAREGCQ